MFKRFGLSQGSAVPILVPEVNPDHIQILGANKKNIWLVRGIPDESKLYYVGFVVPERDR